MSFEERDGDLFASDLPALAHGCNCAGAMGRGIAVEFRRRWPAMFVEYRRRCAAGSFRLGDVFMWPADDRVIFNLATQQHWRARADLLAIELATTRMLALAEQHGLAAIGLPRIGAGLGGLAWPRVRAVLVPLGEQAAVRMVVFAYQPRRGREAGRHAEDGAGTERRGGPHAAG